MQQKHFVHKCLVLQVKSLLTLFVEHSTPPIQHCTPVTLSESRSAVKKKKAEASHHHFHSMHSSSLSKRGAYITHNAILIHLTVKIQVFLHKHTKLDCNTTPQQPHQNNTKLRNDKIVKSTSL